MVSADPAIRPLTASIRPAGDRPSEPARSRRIGRQAEDLRLEAAVGADDEPDQAIDLAWRRAQHDEGLVDLDGVLAQV